MVSIRFKMAITVFIIINISSLGGLSCGTLPAEDEKCLAADTNCMVHTINDILRRYPQGKPSFGLNPLDVVEVSNIVISKAPANNPIQLNLQFNRFIVKGLESAIIERVEGFEKDPKTSKFEIYFRMKGQFLLLLPFEGNGKANIDLQNMKFGCKVNVSVCEAGRLTIPGVSRKVQFVKVNFENLYKTDRVLSDSLNNVINANWREVWTELEDGINNV